MGSGSSELHEEGLPPDVIDRHRAVRSMMEELEAVDWYDQRVAATSDVSLAEILAHNRDEEKEHFVMVLEWFRRRDAKMSQELKEKLFTTGSLVAKEVAKEVAGEIAAGGSDASRTPGSATDELAHIIQAEPEPALNPMARLRLAPVVPGRNPATWATAAPSSTRRVSLRTSSTAIGRSAR